MSPEQEEIVFPKNVPSGYEWDHGLLEAGKTNPEFYYCHVDPKKDIKCNDMDDNLSIRIFYLFCSFYFYLQAL